ncbi:MAG: lipoyl(octanoyl) transferase LipB [Gemmatimonadota bacterium]|nr:lipoyl(octanoyl) transferase LipB [Gemmatimonadota bacterium]
MTAPLAVLRLGRVPYLEALDLQRRLADRRQQGDIDRDLLLLLEHEPTITLGRGTRPESLPLAVEELQRRGLTVAEVDRGGDVTWHGPGQLVGYPILDLRRHRQDLHWYLRQVEESLIDALGRLQLRAERNPGYTGVWTRGRKIASIGIHVRQWVTTHGFALNVTNDLDDFGLIVPCGIDGVMMTTVERELGVGGSAGLWATTLDAVVAGLAQVFSLAPEPATLADLLPEGTGPVPRAL